MTIHHYCTLSNDYKDGSSVDGFQYSCKECDYQSIRKWAVKRHFLSKHTQSIDKNSTTLNLIDPSMLIDELKTDIPQGKGNFFSKEILPF